MSETRSKAMRMRGAVTWSCVLVAVAIVLWFELREPGLPVWNAVLTVLLAGLVVAGVWLQLFFVKNSHGIGEARFDTRNAGERRD